MNTSLFAIISWTLILAAAALCAGYIGRIASSAYRQRWPKMPGLPRNPFVARRRP